jgi:hypothetical protein
MSANKHQRLRVHVAAQVTFLTIHPAHPPVSVPALASGNQIDGGYYKGFFRNLLILLCHFFIHRLPLFPQTARAPGQRLDQPDGKLTADRGNRIRHMPLRPHRRRLVAGKRRVAQVF